MTRTEIRTIVIEELASVQRAIGCPIPMITDTTRPIGDLEKFDSPISEDTTVTILARLGAPPETKNPFTMRDAGLYATLGRIVDHFYRALGLQEENP